MVTNAKIAPHPQIGGLGIPLRPIVLALVCAAIASYHAGCIEPALRARLVRPIALVLASALSALAIGAVAFLPVLPTLVVLGVLLPWLVLAAAPGLLAWTSRGRRALLGDRDRALKLMTLASDYVAMREPQQWQATMGALGSLDDPEAHAFTDAARRYTAEVAAGAPASPETIARFQTEAQRYLSGPRVSHRFTTPLAIVLAAVIGLVPALVVGTPSTPPACDDGDELLAAERQALTTAAPDAEPPAPSVLAPGDRYTSLGSGTLSLEEAAGTRYDPDTLNQLREAQFLLGYWADWIEESGTKLGADAFVFASQSGALDFQRAVTHYACRYAKEAFPIPGGGVGLRIRYGSGDPIRDQAAWVVGPARVVIAIGFRNAPPDHQQIAELVRQLRP